MPRLSVWYIRAALIYLGVGFSFGGLILWHKGVPFHPLVWRLLPTHIEFLLFGWIVQLGLGVAYWILPRIQTRRGNMALAWLAWGLLNGGVWLVALSSLLAAPVVIGFVGRLAETGAALAFAVHSWPRVKSLGR